MNREGHENTDFFIGEEVEHTPALGMKTLFVVGLQSPAEIQKILDDPLAHAGSKIEHIYFGANQSFPNLVYGAAREWNQWESMIMHFLDLGYWCTLDIDVSSVPGLNEGCLCEQDRFIPMISVKVPYARILGYNAVIKIDDVDYRHSNPGVWCHSLHDLMDRDRFTDWSKYEKDETVK